MNTQAAARTETVRAKTAAQLPTVNQLAFQTLEETHCSMGRRRTLRFCSRSRNVCSSSTRSPMPYPASSSLHGTTCQQSVQSTAVIFIFCFPKRNLSVSTPKAKHPCALDEGENKTLQAAYIRTLRHSDAFVKTCPPVKSCDVLEIIL